MTVIVVVIILFSLVFTVLKTNETFPSCLLKNTCQNFRALKKKPWNPILLGQYFSRCIYLKMAKSILDNGKNFHTLRRTNAWRTWCIRKAAKEEQSKCTINPLAPRNEQNINSPQFQYILWQTSDEKRQLYHPQGCYVDVLPNSPQ